MTQLGMMIPANGTEATTRCAMCQHCSVGTQRFCPCRQSSGGMPLCARAACNSVPLLTMALPSWCQHSSSTAVTAGSPASVPVSGGGQRGLPQQRSARSQHAGRRRGQCWAACVPVTRGGPCNVRQRVVSAGV